ncbi:MAG: radical SAM protein, partial [Candidatus Omnitrophica bacterium]|nr:radical SAM protein [Candidatus Omnitrophota bacterium]
MEKGKIQHTFGWDLCHRCNYHCPYCGVWKDNPDKDPIMTVEEWDLIWTRVYNNYGSCHIYMSGGEPSAYPYFYDLVAMLCKKHSIEVCTNLSWDVERL